MLEISEAARERISKLGYDPQYGARPLKRVLQKEIMNELSKQILFLRTLWTLNLLSN